MLHNYRQESIDLSGKWDGYTTVIQSYKCRLCGHIVAVPEVMQPPNAECSGVKAKVIWQHPIKGGNRELTKKDYPKKAQNKRNNAQSMS